MSRFSTIDLSKLPAPDIVEVLDFEAVFAALMADVTNRLHAAGISYDVGALETDPVAIVMQAAAAREVLMRARVNDGVKAVMLAYSWGTNLDHLGAYLGTARGAGESDDRFRARIQLAIEAFSTAGPYGAYYYHAMSAAPADIKDVLVVGPESGIVSPGQVGIYVLSYIGSGAAGPALIAAVQATCDGDDARPLTDEVLVSSAGIETYTVEMTIKVPRGPDAETIRTLVQDRLTEYVASRHAIGRAVSIAGLYAAGMAPGVEDVDLATPTADVEPGATTAAYCTAATVLVEILD